MQTLDQDSEEYAKCQALDMYYEDLLYGDDGIMAPKSAPESPKAGPSNPRSNESNSDSNEPDPKKDESINKGKGKEKE